MQAASLIRRFRFRPFQRIRTSADFQRSRELAGRGEPLAFSAPSAASSHVMKSGRIRSGCLTLYRVPSRLTDDPTTIRPCRLGLIATRKNLRRAHDRNRCKRRLRETFRLRQHECPTNEDWVIVIGKPANEDALNHDTERLFKWALRPH